MQLITEFMKKKGVKGNCEFEVNGKTNGTAVM